MQNEIILTDYEIFCLVAKYEIKFVPLYAVSIFHIWRIQIFHIEDISLVP